MDIHVIATSAVAALTPYLVKAGTVAAEKLGEKLPEAIENLYNAIRKKFKSEPYAEQTLTRAVEKPESPGRQAALADVLAEEMEKDAEFAATLEKIMERVEESSAGDRIDQSVNVSGKSGDITVIGKGDFNKHPD